MSVVQKRVLPASEGDAARVNIGGEFIKRFPGLWEFLVLDRYPDGDRRQTATLLLFSDEGGVKVCLNDRDQGMSAWYAGDCPLLVLDALERNLQEGRVEWRASGGKGKRGHKRS